MQFEDMDNDNEEHHEEKQSKDIGEVEEKIAAKPGIPSSLINACLKELNKNEEKEEGNPWIRKLRGENRKDTKDKRTFLYETPPEIKGKNALITYKKSPSKAACKLHGVKCTKIH